MKSFAYTRGAALGEVLSAMGNGARPLAGGTDLLRS